jgi:hypothetical protein
MKARVRPKLEELLQQFCPETLIVGRLGAIR